VLTSAIEVRPDPRVKMTPEELAAQHRLTLAIYDEIARLSETVIALQSVREQIKQRQRVIKDLPDGETWVKQADGMLKKLDALEEKLHNPKATVTYDILAQKGGAKLYSQLVPLYDTVKDSDGPVTQGMRDAFAEHARELRGLEKEWQRLVE